MRIVRLELCKFRGIASLELIPTRHAVLVGEPRAGRSTIIDAIRRVLDPSSTRHRPSPWDIHRPLADVEADDEYPLTWVEVALAELGDEAEQELDEKLELLDPTSGLPSTDSTTAVLGVRMRYCLQYRPYDDSLEHWVEYVRSAVRVPRAHREILRAIVIDRAAPLQLRAEGGLRSLAANQDEDRLLSTIEAFGHRIHEATEELAESDTVKDALKAIASNGARFSLGVSESDLTDGIGFASEDGSVSGLLRTIQPMLDIDEAGVIPLSSHGSTTSAVLSTSEAMASSRMDHRIVIVDDFGDSLDSASADFLASRLSRPKNQVWLSTRRPEVLGAFEAEDLIRLTRHTGEITAHQLPATTDKSERVMRRYLAQILAGAMSARTLVLVEGPHDVESIAALDRKRYLESNKAPLSAQGAQVVAASAGGSDGGKHRLPVLARLGISLGFEVRAVLDSDKPGEDDELLAELVELCDLVVTMPSRTAIERALVRGLPVNVLRESLEALNTEHKLGLRTDAVSDESLEKTLVKQLKQKGGLHRLFVAQLPDQTYPPIATGVLQKLKAPLSEMTRVEIPEP